MIEITEAEAREVLKQKIQLDKAKKGLELILRSEHKDARTLRYIAEDVLLNMKRVTIDENIHKKLKC